MRDYTTVELHLKDDLVWIYLNRPEKRNALNDVLVVELKDILKRVQSNKSIKGIILTGKGEAFCSGADLGYLKNLRKFSDEENLQDSLELMELFYLLYTHSKPCLALVNGAAIAGGAGLAICCDFIIAEQHAKFGFPEIKIGFIPAMVSTLLIAQIGERRARQLLLTGELVNAQSALQLHMINKVFSGDLEKEELVNSYINMFKKASPEAFSHTKKLISNRETGIIYRNLVINAKRNANFRKSQDFKEGLDAFLNKRRPSWM